MTSGREDGLLDVLVLEQPDDVADVGVQRDVGSEQVGSVGEARQGWGVDQVSLCSQPVGDSLPAPAAVPTAMDEDERWHPELVVGPAHGVAPPR